jgi:hypothetical protein
MSPKVDTRVRENNVIFVKWRAQRRACKVSGKEAASAFQPKDVVTMFIATVSLVVSGTVAYRNVFYSSEELQAVVTTHPWLYTKSIEPEVYVQGAFDALFINSGTRPIAVVKITLAVIDNAKDDTAITEDHKRLCSYPRLVSTTVGPFVIKEKEIVHKHGQARIDKDTSSLAKARDDVVAFAVPPLSETFPEYRGQLIMCVEIATTTHTNVVGTIELNEVSMHLTEGESVYGVRLNMTPNILWSR